jgi:hypothetical protein
MIGNLRRWRMGYLAIAFVALIPIATYKWIQAGLPKKGLLFLDPIYALLAWSFYTGFKRGTKPK